MNTRNFISVPIETSQFLNLAEFLREEKSEFDPAEAIAFALDYWMENASWKPELIVKPRQADKGYHWKNIFMPNGTSLRMKYRGETYYAAVQGDQVIFGGKVVSPSEFTRLVTETSRNAWRDIYIKRPNDLEWIFADKLRIAE